MGADTAIAEPWERLGFEGFEKRLEIDFFSSTFANSGGLRTLTRSELDNLLKPAECTIVSELHNNLFDSYVLSESSLFVYPLRIILKTCGRTQLLKSIPLLLHHASALSLQISRCKYSRGTFTFPQNQPYPYTCFSEEIRYLDEFFGHLAPAECKSCVMGDASRGQKWHIYSAADEKFGMLSPLQETFTLEMCMTELDRVVTSQFFNESGSKTGQEMTAESGIGGLLPNARICDFAFTPCGYSMNGMENGALSTIHITPEENYSYASFEAMGYNPDALDLQSLVNRVLSCFRPATFIMSVHSSGWRGRLEAAGSWGSVVLPLGYVCGSSDRRELPGDGMVTFHTFRKSCVRNWGVIPQPLFPKAAGRDDERARDVCGIQTKNGDSECCGSCSNFEENSGKGCGGIMEGAIEPLGMKLNMLKLCDRYFDVSSRRAVRYWDARSSASGRRFDELHCIDGLISDFEGIGAGFFSSFRTKEVATDNATILPNMTICAGSWELPSEISSSIVSSEMELFLLQGLCPNAALIVRFPLDDAGHVCPLGSPAPQGENRAEIDQLLFAARKLSLRVVRIAADFPLRRVLFYGDIFKTASEVFESACCTAHPMLKPLDLVDVLLIDVSERWLAKEVAKQAVVKKFPAATEVEVIAKAGRAPKADGGPTRGAPTARANPGERNGIEANALL